MTPEACPRMGQLGRSFQRIRYHRLRFEVVAGWPSTVSGSYVAGFVKDATDPVKGSSATATLLASGGTATKFWQSSNIVVGALPDLYYTSTDPEEQRWASPGSFVISVVGPPSTTATFEVFVHWDVSFYEPTYESGGKVGGFSTALVDLYTSAGNSYLSKRKSDDWEPAVVTDFSPPLFSGAELTLLSMRSASVRNSSGVFSGVFNFRRVKVISGAIYPIDDLANYSKEKFFDQDYVIFAGEKAEVVKPPNLSAVSWFHSALRRHACFRALPESGPSQSLPAIGRGRSTMERSSSLKACSTSSKARSIPILDSLPNISPILKQTLVDQLSPEALSLLMASLTEFQQPLKESSPNSDSEFEVLPE